IERNLVFETLPRLIGSPLPESQPGSLPVRIGGARAVWKALLQLAEVIDGAIIIALQQVHVSGRKQGLFEPRAGGTELPQLIQGALHGLFIAGRTLGLTQQVEALGFSVARLRSHGSQNLAGITASVAFFQRSRQRQLHFGTLRRTDFSREFPVIMRGVAIVLGF